MRPTRMRAKNMKNNVLLFILSAVVFMATSCHKDKALVTTFYGQVYHQNGSPFTEKCFVRLDHDPYDINKIGWGYWTVETDSKGSYVMELDGEFADGITTMWAFSDPGLEGGQMISDYLKVQVKPYESNHVNFSVYRKATTLSATYVSVSITATSFPLEEQTGTSYIYHSVVCKSEEYIELKEKPKSEN